MNNPCVSVIMPAYNGEKYIGESIESIREQTFQNWELIIVEDCSNDHTLHIVQTYLNDSRIRLIKNPENIGIAASRNRAIEEARGMYIAIQDDDDISFPDRLYEEVKFLDTHPEIDAVAGHWIMVDEGGHNIIGMQQAFKNPKYVRACLLFRCCIGNGSAMFRKKTVIKYGLKYQENMLGMEDYRFWIDLSKVGNISAVDRLVYKNRRHNQRETIRSRGDGAEERRKLFLELQVMAIRREGIELSTESVIALKQLAGETTDANATAQDYEKLYMAFQSIIHQAKELKLDNTEEIAIACRKIMGAKIGNSKSLWKESTA